MSFRQVYYTSCKTGLRGSPGFQVHAATPGIPDNVMQQVERQCVYVPPLSAPTRPGPSELAQYPLALIYEKLPDGSRVLAQSRYIGQDYSGRFGNFFAHSIITAAPDKDFATVLPIQLWRSEFWRTTEVTGTELPETTVPPLGNTFDLPSISRFVNENGRLAHVANFLTAVEQALRTRRKIVIIDTSDAVASWIAVAALVLPRNLALALTFNTYVKNPYQTDVLIVGTTTDSDFGFAPHEISHQVFLFDFVGSRFTPIEQTSLFSRTVADCFRDAGLAQLAEFCAFAGTVEPALPIDSLEVALATYKGLSGVVLPGVSGAALAGFCAARLARFPAAQVGAVIELALAGEAMAALESALLLLGAAGQPDVTGALKVAAQSAVIAWSVRKAARTASSEAIAQLVTALAAATERRVAAQPYQQEWQALISGTKDPVRLLWQLLLGEQLGYLANVDTTLEELGEKVIGPALHEPKVQKLVIRLVGGGQSTPLVNGLAGCLLRQVAKPQAFLQLGLLLPAAEVMDRLESWAVNNQALLLHFRLIGARAHAEPNSWATAFSRCLTVARDSGDPLTSQLVEQAFESCWIEGQPTAKDALRILTVVDRALLAQTYLPARLVDRLLLSGSAPLEALRIELAAQLKDAALIKAMGEKASILKLFQAAHLLEGADWQDKLPAVVATMQQEGPMKSTELCRLTAERIVKVADLDRQHKAVLRVCDLLKAAPTESPAEPAPQPTAAPPVAGESAWFVEAYVQAMERQFDPDHSVSPTTIVELLQHWQALESSAHPGLGTSLITRVLPVAVRDWKRPELKLAKEALGKDETARKNLRTALAAKGGSRGVLAWFATLFLGLSLFITGAWFIHGKKVYEKYKHDEAVHAAQLAGKPDPAIAPVAPQATVTPAERAAAQ